MHFIDRQVLTVPKLLSSKKVDQAREEVRGFLAQTDQVGGTRRVPSSEWLTGNDMFRQDLHAEFGGTCAYCEQVTSPRFKQDNSGVASHHRPESLAQDEIGNTELSAYAWLMYDWENILWVCADCFRRKGNRFYVQAKRGEPGMPIKALREFEYELILDPCFHQPSEHLVFHLDGTIDWKTSQGQTTVKVLKLDREELVRSRNEAIIELLNVLEASHQSVEALPTQAKLITDQHLFFKKAESLGELVISAHIGASTNAVLEYANLQAIPADSAANFLSSINALETSRRKQFWSDALRVARRGVSDKFDPLLAAEETVPLRGEASVRKNRLPDVKDLTTALTPISNVKISNFKALRNITFELPTAIADLKQSPCMILLGENATGKSSVLEAMALTVIGTEEAHELNTLLKDEELSPSDLMHRPDPSRWDEPNEKLDIQLGFIDAPEQAHLHAVKGDARFSGSQSCSKIVLGYGPRRYFTNQKSRRYRAPVHRVRSLFDPLDMIANPIHWLSKLKNQQFFAAARALREILMLDNEDDFERDDDENTRGQIFIRQNGQRTALKDLSVGYKSIIAMACDIIRELLYHFDNVEFAHAVVFIDEIETHLHPRWKMQIMQLLRNAFPMVQFIVTTHDPLCLRGMYDGEVFVLQRGGADAQVEKLEELPSIRGMRAEQILTSEFFGLGSTDPETDAQLARYNILAARNEDLDDVELREMEMLRGKLDTNMVIGSTLAEQAYAEVLKEQTRNIVQPSRVNSPRRKQLKARFSSLFERVDES